MDRILLSIKTGEKMIIGPDLTKGRINMVISGRELKKKYKGYTTLLSMAIAYGNLDAIEEFVKCGSDVNGISVEGLILDHPMTFARFIDDDEQFKKIVIHFMALGGAIDGVGINNITLLSYTCIDQNPNRIRFLLSKGANANGTIDSIPILEITRRKKGEEFEACVEALMIYDCIRIKNNDVSYLTSQMDFLYEKNIDGLEIPELIKKIARAYGIPYTLETSLVELKENIKLLDQQLDVVVGNKKCLFSEYLEKVRTKNRPTYKNTLTLTGDSIHLFSDMNLMTVPGDEWCFHVSEIPTVIKSRKNPYTNQYYKKEAILEMVESLNFFNYYSDPREVFVRPVLHNESYSSFLNFVVSTVDPYLNIENVKKIRKSLLIELVFLSINDMYIEPFLKYLDDADKFLNFLSVIILGLLRIEDIHLNTIVHSFGQVIEDNILCDTVLEILEIDKNDQNSIDLFFTMSLEDVAVIFGQEKWDNCVRLLIHNGEPLHESWTYISNKIINKI